MEQNLSKEVILLDYANSIYVGKTKDTSGGTINMDGVGTAAYHLFGKHDLKSLSLSEAATIVALFTAPNGLLGGARNGNTQPLLKARNSVLRKVVEADPAKYQETASRAASEPLILRAVDHDIDPRDVSEAYFFDSLSRSANIEFHRNARVQTTLDPILEKFAAAALSEELASVSAARGLDLNGTLVALDPQNGAVRALVGGVDRAKSELNRAHARYSPGSTFKPFLYADAFDRGSSGGVPFTPAYRLDLNEGSINGWMPADHIAGMVLPRTGLSASSNRAALAVANMIGMAPSCELQQLAFSSTASCTPQLLLGGGRNSGVTALAVAEAYAAFANGGERIAAGFTNGVETKRRRLFSAGAAFVTLQLLRSVIGDSTVGQATFGNGKHLAGLPPTAELGGKTGSTDTTLWVAVIHPRLIVVVAVGTDDNQKLDGLFGASVAGLVWARFVRESLSAASWYFGGQFVRPQDVVELGFDPKLGCITETGAAREFFLAKRRPRHCD